MNQLTHWIDASNIYGSTDEEAKLFRTFSNGLLIEANQNGVKSTEQLPKCDENERNGENLPNNSVSCGVCEAVKVHPDGSCFAAGMCSEIRFSPFMQYTAFRCKGILAMYIMGKNNIMKLHI